MEYGYPRLTFSMNNNETVRLEMPIDNGSLTNCIQTGSDPEKCDPPVSISGKDVRATLLKGEAVDPRVMRPSTSEILGKAMKTA